MTSDLDKLKVKFEKTLSAASDVEKELNNLFNTIPSQESSSPHQERIQNKSKSNDGLSK